MLQNPIDTNLKKTGQAVHSLTSRVAPPPHLVASYFSRIGYSLLALLFHALAIRLINFFFFAGRTLLACLLSVLLVLLKRGEKAILEW
ncbi:hypothetical protein HMPREF1869_00807 [Bacteroidales bacterium KA00251]|nr:hypothetical protein HMPREF1869_00807 [Bacteroidales bacterium KA00251]